MRAVRTWTVGLDMRRQLITGMLCGWALWLLLYAAAFAIEASETYWPRLLRDADLPDTLGSVLS